ncbi:DUF4192 domain-containing protein [Streptomyces sp. AHA2]|uniref:DUF4192 domain-containing protein n=1 Tax=Streptomyces sp. AHA2 TaxID=3064526 RepID=UPI002FE0D649
MTNHSEATGSSENGDITEGVRRDGHAEHPSGGQKKRRDDGPGRPAHTAHDGPVLPAAATPYDGPGEHQVTLRTPAELADALPYLLGYRPEDSIVLVALHDRDGRGRFGGRARLGIPGNADDWPSAARQLAHGLVRGSERRGSRPESMVAFLCQEPARGETGREVMERLRPLAQRLRTECGSLDAVVVEALCISEGRYWSYCCDNAACCPPEGTPMGLPGTSVLAAAATYAGIQVRGTLRELRARLLPWENAAALAQEAALDRASMELVPRILDDAGRAAVADETVQLAAAVLDRYAEAQPVSGTLLADLRDDELLGYDEAAKLVLGLQDRSTRDRAAEWMEGDEAGSALRLWRSLARRCVGPYGEHAAAPLTLAGWVAWSTGDELEAREALAMALGADPDYLFARLLHQACNEGLDPESVRRCLRSERTGRVRADATGASQQPHDRMQGGEQCQEGRIGVAVRVGEAEEPRENGSALEADHPHRSGQAQAKGQSSLGPGTAAPRPSGGQPTARRRRRARPTLGDTLGRALPDSRDQVPRRPGRAPADTARPGRRRPSTADTARSLSASAGRRPETADGPLRENSPAPCRVTNRKGVQPGHTAEEKE